MPYDNNPTSKMGPYHMESVKQERKNLMDDNPVVKDASGGRPWIAKHFKSSMSPLKDMHNNSPAEKELVGKQGNLNAGLRAAIEAAPEDPVNMNYDGLSKKYTAAGHQNDEEMKKAFKEAAEGAGEAGAKVVKKIYKK